MEVELCYYHCLAVPNGISTYLHGIDMIEKKFQVLRVSHVSRLLE